MHLTTEKTYTWKYHNNINNESQENKIKIINTVILYNSSVGNEKIWVGVCNASRNRLVDA